MTVKRESNAEAAVLEITSCPAQTPALSFA
jgi:hypothetical protein